MRKIKVVQIGIGHDHAPGTLETLLRMSDVYEVAGLVLPENEAQDYANFVKQFEDIPKLTLEQAFAIPDLDAVIVETEERNLNKYALKAFEAGYPVHMDKPGGLDLTEFEKTTAAAKSKNLPFHMGYMYRYNTAVKEALRKIKNGELGEIFCVEAQMNCQHPDEKRQWLDRFPGGEMFFLGCHLVDLILQIQGMPEEIIPLNRMTEPGKINADDFGMAVFKYKNGISFAKSCDNETGGFMRRQLVVCGTKGTVEIRPLEANDEAVAEGVFSMMKFTPKDKEFWDIDLPFERTATKGRYDDMMREFVEIVCKDKENPYTYEYELQLYKAILKACGKQKGKTDESNFNK